MFRDWSFASTFAVMFDIHIIRESDQAADRQRFGRITVGDFSEKFACHDVDVAVDAFPAVWKARLASLLNGEQAVALVHDPRFAWIVYRVSDICYIQQRLAINGCFKQIPSRQTVSEDGERISEWPVPLNAVAQFVNA